MVSTPPASISTLGRAIRTRPGTPGGDAPAVQIGTVTTAPSVIGGRNFVTVNGRLMKYCTGLALAVNDIVVYAQPAMGQYPVVIGELVV